MILLHCSFEIVFSKQKMSGLKKANDVSIKKGVFKDDKQFYAWFNAV